MDSLRFSAIAGILLCVAVPRASGIFVAGSDPNSPTFSASGLGGLAFFADSSSACSGALFEPSLSYLITAAHCVQGLSSTLGTAYVQLVNANNFTTGVSAVYVNPGFSVNDIQVDDIAILKLSSAAPAGTPYYPIYTGNSAVGDEILLAGYGDAGTGTSGDEGIGNPAYAYYSKTPREGTNYYDFTSATSQPPGATQPIFESGGTDILYDFDSGSAVNNADLFAGFLNSNNGSYTNGVLTEASLGPGDSGGPSLVNVNGTLEIAGIHSFVTCYTSDVSGSSYCATPPAGSATFNYGYATVDADTDVSLFTNFIDSTIGVTPAAVPEPATFGMLACGLSSVVVFWRRRLQIAKEL